MNPAPDPDPALFALFFEALQRIDTNDLMGAGRVHGAGVSNMEPKELGLIGGEGIEEAMR